MSVHLNAKRQAGPVGKKNTIIEINGKHYDSRTGLVASGHVPDKASVAKKPSRAKAKRPANQLAAHRPVPARTLMRHAVKKPASGHKLRARGPADSLTAQPMGQVIISKPIRSLDQQRLQKSARVAKSQLINHFSTVTASDFAPAAQPTVVAPIVTATRPVSRQPHSQAAKSTTTAELLERALQHATSHQQEASPKSRRQHKRTKHHLKIGAALAAPLILLLLRASQNLTGIRLQLAAARIGFSTKLPDYQPPGFSQGALNYSPGVVAAQFHSNSDSRAYTVTQKRSAWDDSTLREQFLAPTDAQYVTTEVAGRTIYLYGQRNATWLNDGIWYVVQSNGALNDRQLIRIATSL